MGRGRAVPSHRVCKRKKEKGRDQESELESNGTQRAHARALGKKERKKERRGGGRTKVITGTNHLHHYTDRIRNPPR